MLIALVVLSIVCAGLALACVWLSGRQRDQQAQAAELAKQLAVFEQRLKEQGKRIESYQQINIRMGEELRELTKQVAPLPERLVRIEQRDPTSLSFSQAARLVGMGASPEDLTQSCGLSQAEAELVARLHQGKVRD
ncbi:MULTISPECIES: DUF2802 domain-containing protein [Pseudomonas]|uniref:DUF2802 domain-containing protein n=1 Tax=Pseudomonas TaxID=286 RepID=UPI0009FF466A|nr:MULTISPECIES: DUF2802 domain-containing protein [Pseudomonas]NMZ57802.1 DUF2802 domain-containing protein [Pseudomonas nitroreducens]UCL85441.1 DUF2802 domain-containing protein [Pseudomonas sp. HS-18]WEW97475.1 DUF2802 domain-containing protein [Pseudomonas nitroreducens]SNS06025.1 Protein of unknown function [Pseudomonas nitroreducens]